MDNEFRCSECKRTTYPGCFNVSLEMCDPCARPYVEEYKVKRYKAMAIFNQAIKTGEVERRSSCELCDSKSRIVGHHWRGYDYPLDVWQICDSCNGILRGRKYHNGSVSKEEARHVVEANRKARQDNANRPRTKKIILRNYKVAFEIRLKGTRYKYEAIVMEAPDQRVAADFAREFVKSETGAEEIRYLWAQRYYAVYTQP